jgi:hypothetical protein
LPKYETVELHVHGDNHRLPPKAGFEQTAIPEKVNDDDDK